MSLTREYVETARAAGREPNPTICRVLEAAGHDPAGALVLSTEAELHKWEERQRLEPSENTAALLPHLQALCEALENPIKKAAGVLAAVDALQNLHPSFSEYRDDVLGRELLDGVSRHLSHVYPGPLLSLTDNEFESVNFFLEDKTFSSLFVTPALKERYDSLKERIKPLQDTYSISTTLLHFLPELRPSLASLTVPERFFVCSPDEAASFARVWSASLDAADSLAVSRITDLVQQLSAENLVSHMPILAELVILLRKPSIAAALNSEALHFNSVVVNALESYLRHARDDLQAPCSNTNLALITRLTSIRQYRMVLNSSLDSLTPLLQNDANGMAKVTEVSQTLRTLLTTGEESTVRAARELLKQHQKGIQTAITEFAGAPANGFATTTPPANSVFLIYAKPDGHLVAGFPKAIEDLCQLMTSLAAIGYDPQRLALPADATCCAQMAQHLMPCVITLQTAATFYNGLSNSIRPYQKIMVLKLAQTFEQELHKVVSNSHIQPLQTFSFNIGSAEALQDPSNPIGRIRKITSYVQNAYTVFKQKLGVLEQFHAKNFGILSTLSQTSLARNGIRWEQLISDLKDSIREFSKRLPDTAGNSVEQYWAGALAKILAVSYDHTLSTNLALLSPLKEPLTIIQGTLTLSRRPTEVRDELLRQLGVIVSVPTRKSYQISDNPLIVSLYDQMRLLAIEKLPRAYAIITSIMSELRDIEAFLQERCTIVLLSGTQNSEECASRIKDVETCRNLIEYSQKCMSDITGPEEFLTASLPFLIPKSASERYHYVLRSSHGLVTVNIEGALRLMERRPLAITEVTVSAASFHAERLASEILNVSIRFTKQYEATFNAVVTSETFSSITDFLKESHDIISSTLLKSHKKMMQFREILQYSAHLQEGIIRLVDSADAAFQKLQEQHSNIQSDLDNKKKDYWDVLVERLVGSKDSLLTIGTNQLSVIASLVQDLTDHCKRCVSIRAPASSEDHNHFFKCLFFVTVGDGGELVFPEVTSMKIVEALHDPLEKVRKVLTGLEDINKEATVLFSTDYTSLLDPRDASQLRQCVTMLQALNPSFWDILKLIGDVEQRVSEFLRYEWAIAKGRLDLLESIASLAQSCCTALGAEFQAMYTAIGSVSYSDSPLTNTLFQTLGYSCESYLYFISQLCTLSQPVFKALRSPSLSSSHFLELAEKTGLGMTTKYFQKNGSSRLPDGITGAVVLFITAASLFTGVSVVTAETVQTHEYKKLLSTLKEICTRAENEQSIRSAVDETAYWIRSETTLPFTIYQLSPHGREELHFVEIGIDRQTGVWNVPLSASWKQILSRIVEKKAILSAVRSNPYARAIKDQLEECSAILECLARLGHVLATSARQVNILEPVMGRKVLPEELRKFYDSLSILYSLFLNDCDEETANVCLNECTTESSVSISISLMNILQAPLPSNVGVLQRYTAHHAGTIVDTSVLGPFKDTIVALENISAVFSDVQISLRRYLEQKRILFPRFYFLADIDVLEILSTGSTKPEATLKQFTKKLFATIESLQFTASGDQIAISGFVSPEGEKVDLLSAVTIAPSAPPELWLNRFDIAHKDTLRQQLLYMLKLVPEAKSSRQINSLNLPTPNTTSQDLATTSPFDIVTSYSMVKATVSPFGYDTSDFYQLEDYRAAISQKLDFQGPSGEILCVGFAVLTTARIDDALYRKDTLAACTEALQANQKQMQQYLAAFSEKLCSARISTAAFGTTDYVMGLKLKNMAVDITHYLDVLEELLVQTGTDDEVLTARQWIWARELKYRIHRQTQELYVFALDSITPYLFEYQGLQARLIHTPLTSRCYNTLSEAIALRLGGVLQGPAGTGKTESTKALGSKLGRTVLCFNCDTSIERSDLSRLLIGIILSGSIGCFDEFNRLASSVLSAVATDIEAIQKVIFLRSGGILETINETSGIDFVGKTFTLGEITVPISTISPYSCLYVTLNPASREYRGRSELPHSLTRLLRGCYMGSANTSLIVTTILSTSGFTNAKVLAEKCTLAYLLCARRIPAQVHLDWGLRSMQAVLRQAALIRANECKVDPKFAEAGGASESERLQMETSIIIKCISDATLSRITGGSISIFMEILKGVFGEQAVERCFGATKRYGSANALEDKIVAVLQDDLPEKYGVAVLQLYRALTAKMGVALLGPPGSGKTCIIELLKTAVSTLTGGKLEIREFRIAPKSMSRQDLLGYVDPLTGEWNDGALSSAARHAMRLLAITSAPHIWPFIVLDGSIDPLWIEALNSVLDDNRLLTMSSGERIRFPACIDPLAAFFNSADSPDRHLQMPLSFLFETDSLQHASPATVSRLAVIVVPARTVDDVMKSIDSPDIPLDGFRKFCTGGLPQAVAECAAEVCEHMFLCGQGEIKLHGRTLGSAAAFARGCIRAWYSELTNRIRDGAPGELTDMSLGAMASTVSMGTLMLQGSLATPRHAAGSGSTMPQIDWAKATIHSFIASRTPILVVGRDTCGKYTSVIQAVESANPPCVALTLSCSRLTTRNDIISMLMSQCIESQTPEGARLIRPRTEGTTLLLVVRDCDVIQLDEFHHIETFTFLWSLVAHGKYYGRGGVPVHISDIVVVIIVKSLARVPLRLRRRMGIVFMEHNTLDIEAICGPSFYKYYAQLEKRSQNLHSWKTQMVHEAEMAHLKALQTGKTDVITLIEYLKNIGTLNMFGVATISAFLQENEGLSADHIVKLLELLLEVPIPYAQGKSTARNELRTLGNNDDNHVLTYAQPGSTAQEFQRAFSTEQCIPPEFYKTLSLNLITNKERVSRLQELLGYATEYYPGLRLYQTYVQILAMSQPLVSTVLHEYLKLLSAIEVGLMTAAGLVVLAQPYCYSIETAVVGALTVGCSICFAGTDPISPVALRAIAERVAAGHQRIAYFIDDNTLETDKNWYGFLSAIANKDILYFQNRLSAADIRSLVATFTDNCGIVGFDSLSELEATRIFFGKLVVAIQPIIILSPEREACDDLFLIIPAVRRRFRLVAFEMLNIDIDTVPITPSENFFERPSRDLAYSVAVRTVAIVSGAFAVSNGGQNMKPLTIIENILKITSSYTHKFLTTYSLNAPPISSYVKTYVMYHLLKSKWMFALNKRKDRLSKGLEQLQKAQKEVDGLSQQITQRSKQVEESQLAANQALEEITKKMSDASNRKLSATELQRELALREKEILKDKEQADQELSHVLPVLQEATKAVQSIPADALTEIKSFASPPPAVATVLEAVLKLLGHQDISWKGMRAFLSQAGALRMIAAFDVKNASKSALAAVNKVIKGNPECFEPSKIQRVSRAAAPLAKWICANMEYGAVCAKIEPLMNAVKRADDSLNDMRKRIDEINQEVTEIEKQTEALHVDFNLKTQQLMKYKQELETLQDRQRHGTALLQGLTTERQRWAGGMKEAAQQLDNIDKCAVNAAILFTLAGKCTDDVRSDFFSQPLLKDGPKTVREAFDELLVNSVTSNRFISLGLSAGTSAFENAAILDLLYSCAKLPNIKDESGDNRDMRNYNIFRAFVLSHATENTGVQRFLEKNPQFEGATFASATSEHLPNLVAIAARFGKTIIITNCDSGHLPSCLFPYLRYSGNCYASSGSVATSGPIGTGHVVGGYVMPMETVSIPIQSAKLSDMHPDFRMIITSSVSMHIPLDISQNVLELSFAPTKKSLTNQYMDCILAEWSPSSLQKIKELGETQLEFSTKLHEIEDNLLDALSAAALQKDQSLLENQTLFNVLKQAEVQTAEIKAATDEVKIIEQELDAIKNVISPLAQAVDQCVTTFASMCMVNSLYVTDQEAILPLLKHCLRTNRPASDNDKITPEQVLKTLRAFQALTASRIQSSFFGTDVVAACLLLLRNYSPKLLTPELFAYFTGTGKVYAGQVPSWVPNNSRNDFAMLLGTFTPDRLEKLAVTNQSVWGTFISRLNSCKDLVQLDQVFPDSAKSLNPLEMAAFASSVRPDMTNDIIRTVVARVLAVDDRPIDSLLFAMTHASGLSQPIAIYSAVGQDITTGLQDVTAINIVPGKEKQADEQLLAALDAAGQSFEAWPNKQHGSVLHTVVIAGAHLSLGWLGRLPNYLNELSSSLSTKYGPMFPHYVRVILLLEPKPHMPESLNRIAWRICLTPEGLPREMFLQALSEWPTRSTTHKFTEAFVKKIAALMYILTALHITLESRRFYTPRGVAIDPNWNYNDLAASLTICSNVFNYKVADEVAFLNSFTQRLQGLFLDAIYGVSTKDPNDKYLIQSLIRLALGSTITTAIFTLIDAGGHPLTVANSVTDMILGYKMVSVINLCDTIPVLRYILPPIHILCNAALSGLDMKPLVDQLKEYVSMCYPEKTTPDQLGLPRNALITRGMKSSLTTRSVLLRVCASSAMGSIRSGLYDKLLQIRDLYTRDIKNKLSAFAELLEEYRGGARGSTAPLVDELILQGDTLLAVSKILDADFDEAVTAAQNYLFASPYIREIATLIYGGVTPERWCSGIVAVPSPSAPHDSPELATVRKGSPSDYITYLLRASNAIGETLALCRVADTQPTKITISLADLPRPAAFLEAIRRFEGIITKQELNHICLHAVTGIDLKRTTSYVAIKQANCILQGCSLGTLVNFNTEEEPLDEVVIFSGSQVSHETVAVPFYVDQNREIGMSGVENIHVRLSARVGDIDTTLLLAGVYVHLSSR
ncbi:Dynein heavy chain [Giardia muris]|uniref:Dynein heavy chain n=1 Tax=Giardia muris TaxID=5742 RepID=A0A4Z1T219_GIAMU|nr:Dynein heavy chain [Giardia muris]|eukprot:TNJ29708.1 Dynein heavy chain [Giardia muris]